MRMLHVGAAQIHSGGGVEDVLERTERQVAAASAFGVDVLLFSECCLQGYDYEMDGRMLADVALPVTAGPFKDLSHMAQAYEMNILMGFWEFADYRFHNSVFVAHADGRTAVERKHRMCPVELGAGVTPGPRERAVHEFGGVRCAIVICMDGGIPDLPEQIRRNRIDFRFCPTGGGGKLSDMLHEEDLDTDDGLARYCANRPRVFNTHHVQPEDDWPGVGFCSANALGPAGENTCHQGHCMIVDNRRIMRAQTVGTIVLEHQQDALIHAELTFPGES